MPIHHAVLGLLARGPSYGYELKAEFEAAIGPQWGELNIGHLYQVLDRLVRDDLVTKKVVEQTRRPDRVVYRMTKRGHDELRRWLDSPVVRRSGYRDDLFLKLFVASRLGREQLQAVLKTQRAAYLAELGSLGDLRMQHRKEPLISLLLEAATLHIGASLKIVDLAERKLPELVAVQGRTAGGTEEPRVARRSAP